MFGLFSHVCVGVFLPLWDSVMGLRGMAARMVTGSEVTKMPAHKMSDHTGSSLLL